MPSPIYRRAVELMEAELGDELVALDPQGGNCFGFNNVAADIWRSLEQPKSFDQIRDELLEKYNVSEDECGRDLRDALHDLVEKGLIAAGQS